VLDKAAIPTHLQSSENNLIQLIDVRVLYKAGLPNWRGALNHRDQRKLAHSHTGGSGTAKPKTHASRLRPQVFPGTSTCSAWFVFFQLSHAST